MGQKVNPISFRLGITETWRSTWYARKQNFGRFVVEDKKVRDFITSQYAFAGIARVDIERTRDEVGVALHCARPGVIIGRKGVEVDKLRAQLERIVGGKVDIKIKEVTRPELCAQLVALGIAEQLGKRSSFRRTIRKAAETTMDAGSLGIRIHLAGRLGGSEMSRRELLRIGALPLHTIRAKVDYGFAEAATSYGKIGVKVWINHGLKTDEASAENAEE